MLEIKVRLSFKNLANKNLNAKMFSYPIALQAGGGN